MDDKTRNKVLLVLFLGVLMGALDIAIVAPALPSIQAFFGVGARVLTWTFTIYVLFNLIGTPLMAKLSDTYGRRSIYTLDVTLFALGSLIVALSPANMFAMLLVGRAMQGFGAGGIFPVASAVIGDTFPPEKRGGALGLIGAVFGLAFLVGPILGGVILTVHWLAMAVHHQPAHRAGRYPLGLARAARHPPRNQPSLRLGWNGSPSASCWASLAFGLNQIDTQNFFRSLALAQCLALPADRRLSCSLSSRDWKRKRMTRS